jgi:hypothetical protein
LGQVIFGVFGENYDFGRYSGSIFVGKSFYGDFKILSIGFGFFIAVL